METIKSELEEILSLRNSITIENQELSKEITSLLNSSDLIMVLVYSRRCLEVMVADICESMLGRERGTEPMKGIIDKIAKEKLVPEFITTAMYNVNNNSTYGAHPKDFDKRQVRSTLIDLTTVFDWYFFDLKRLEKTEIKANIKQNQPVIDIKQSTSKNEIGSKGIIAKKSSGKLTMIIGITIVVIAVVAYLIFKNKTTDIENDKINTQSNDSAINITKQSTLNKPEVNTDTTIASAKPQSEKVKKITTTAADTKALILPDDIGDAIKLLGNKEIPIGKRQTLYPKFKEKFTNDAGVIQLKNGNHWETRTINDFLAWNAMFGSNYDILKFKLSEISGEKINILTIDFTDK